jgi:hypothetical protein
MYFPMSKLSFFFCAAVITDGSVTMAGPSAEAQSHSLLTGSLPAASLMVFLAKSMLWSSG